MMSLSNLDLAGYHAATPIFSEKPPTHGVQKIISEALETVSYRRRFLRIQYIMSQHSQKGKIRCDNHRLSLPSLTVRIVPLKVVKPTAHLLGIAHSSLSRFLRS